VKALHVGFLALNQLDKNGRLLFLLDKYFNASLFLHERLLAANMESPTFLEM
jgi:hypothetical protein